MEFNWDCPGKYINIEKRGIWTGDLVIPDIQWSEILRVLGLTTNLKNKNIFSKKVV